VGGKKIVRGPLENAGQLSKEQQLARAYLKGKIYDALGQTELED